MWISIARAGAAALAISALGGIAQASPSQLLTYVDYYGTIVESNIGYPFYNFDLTGRNVDVQFVYDFDTGIFSSSFGTQRWDGVASAGFIFGGSFGFTALEAYAKLDGQTDTISSFGKVDFPNNIEQISAVFTPSDVALPMDLKSPFTASGTGYGEFDLRYFKIDANAKFAFTRMEIRQFFIPGDGIPEPGSWALLVVGLGVAGGALRYARRARRGLRADPR